MIALAFLATLNRNWNSSIIIVNSLLSLFEDVENGYNDCFWVTACEVWISHFDLTFYSFEPII